jgi:HK97 family phage major capsid protein
MDELKKLYEELAKAVTEMRANLERGNSETAEKANAGITALKAQIRELETKAARPSAAAQDESQKTEQSKAFRTWMARDEKGLSPEQVKLLQVGAEGDGGVAVPEELDRTIGKTLRDACPMLSLVSVINGTESYEKLFDLAGTTSGWVGETDARTETSTPTLTSVKPFFGELYANPFATQKMLDDVFFNAEAWLAESVSEKFAEDIDEAILNGTGTKSPKGILKYTLAETADATRAFGQIEKMTTDTQNSVKDTELIDFVHKLKAGYRQQATWLMSTLMVAKVRKLKDSTTGQFMWQPGLAAGVPDVLLGRPIVEDERVPAPAAGATAALFGDFKRAYKVVMVKGIRVLRDPYTAKPKIGFYTTQRLGGGLEDSKAVKVLVLKS